MLFDYLSLVTQMVMNLPAMQKTWVRSLDREDPLEKEVTRLDYYGSICNMQQYSEKIKNICFFGQLDCYLQVEHL